MDEKQEDTSASYCVGRKGNRTWGAEPVTESRVRNLWNCENRAISARVLFPIRTSGRFECDVLFECVVRFRFGVFDSFIAFVCSTGGIADAALIEAENGEQRITYSMRASIE